MKSLFMFVCYITAACPGGWHKYKENCYKKFPAASWNEASSACARQDATLAQVAIRGLAENEFIKNKFGGGNWLGMSRCHTSSTCLLDFSPALWTNWASGQPDKKPQYLPGQDNKDFAVMIQTDGTWADQPKLEKHPYICEKPGTVLMGSACKIYPVRISRALGLTILFWRSYDNPSFSLRCKSTNDYFINNAVIVVTYTRCSFDNKVKDDEKDAKFRRILITTLKCSKQTPKK